MTYDEVVTRTQNLASPYATIESQKETYDEKGH